MLWKAFCRGVSANIWSHIRHFILPGVRQVVLSFGHTPKNELYHHHRDVPGVKACSLFWAVFSYAINQIMFRPKFRLYIE